MFLLWLLPFKADNKCPYHAKFNENNICFSHTRIEFKFCTNYLFVIKLISDFLQHSYMEQELFCSLKGKELKQKNVHHDHFVPDQTT